MKFQAVRGSMGIQRRLYQWLAVLGAVGLLQASAAAQTLSPGMRPGGRPPPPPGARGAAPKPPTGQPETHAASGGDRPSSLPTTAAQLPENPNKIPKKLKKKLGSDYDKDEVRAREIVHRYYGLYYEERGKDYSLRTVPPLWFDRRDGDDHEAIYGLNYYRRRSPKVDADVVFPLYWNMRHGQTRTTVVGPVMHQSSPQGHATWVAPLVFEGSGPGGEEYLHIPPLLSFNYRTNDSGYNMTGPVFCRWRGGARCDGRTAAEIDYGIAPLYFYGRDEGSEYEIIPPLLHYYKYEEEGQRELSIWGPVWRRSSRDGGSLNVFPFFWHSWGEDAQSTTVLPLFHYDRSGASRTLATPLFVDHVGEEGDHTFATWLYARHRGRTELDMVTPLFWRYADPDIGLSRIVVPPFFYRNTSPRSDDIAILPFYGRFERHGISTTQWFTPLVRHETNLTGWRFNLFPVLHMGRDYEDTHFVFAPIVWDFKQAKARQTVVFPLFWRFTDEEGTAMLVGNTYYGSKRVRGGQDWQFHFFPLFSYGETPNGHWWNVLYGLAGHTQEGTLSKMRLGYIPITLSE